MNSVEVCLTHQQLENYQHIDKNVIVIDVLRATSTINTILFSGAKSVKPVESLEAVSYTHLRAHETRHDLV